MALWRISLREASRRKARTAATVASAAIGVAAVVAFQLTTLTTRTAYVEMFAAARGRASLEVAAAGGGTLAASLADGLARVPDVTAAVPLIQRNTILYVRDRKAAVLALGIDPDRDRAVRDYVLVAGTWFDAEDAILLEEGLARSLHAAAGDTVKVLARRGGLRRLRVAGLVASRGGLAIAYGGMLYMPLGLAQELFTGGDDADAVQLVLRDPGDADLARRELEGRLPAGLTVRPPASHNRAMEQTLLASSKGLKLVSAFSLLLAGFMILNAFLMSLGERRRQLGLLRAIGATRSQITRMLLGESLAVGAAGTAIGIAGGWAAAAAVMAVLARVLEVRFPPLQVAAVPFALAAGMGLGVCVLGVLLPLRRAARLTPLAAMNPDPADDIESPSRWFLLPGAVTTLTSGGLLAACAGRWVPEFIAAATATSLLVGLVLLLPAALPPLVRLAGRASRPWLRVETRLAERQLLRHRTRSSLTAGVLFLAAGVSVGLANAVLDNVRDVRQWARQAVFGDFFVRAAMPHAATGLSASIPLEVDREIRGLPGIQAIESGTFQEAVAAGATVVVLVRDFAPGVPLALDIKSGDPENMRQQLRKGEVVVSTVLAEQAGLRAGDRIALETRGGVQHVRIAALTNEYYAGGLLVCMDRETARRLLGTDEIDGYVVQAEHGQQDSLERELRALCDRHGLLLQSAAQITSFIDRTTQGIVGGLWGLIFLGFSIAALGVVNTLARNVLEQTRELGLLRAVGMTRGQIRRTVFVQAALVAGIGLLPGVAAGVGVAWCVNLATRPFTGHAIEFVFRPVLVAAAFGAGSLVVLLSAWPAAERAARLDLPEALHYE